MFQSSRKHRNLWVFLAVSVLAHFFVLHRIQSYIFAPHPKNSKIIKVSWHLAEALPNTPPLRETNNKPDTLEIASPRLTSTQESVAQKQKIPPGFLTKQPEMLTGELSFVETDYGYQAKGSITVELTIGKDGRVKKATKVESTTRPLFEDQVINHLQKSVWSPAEFNGTPVETKITIQIEVGG